MRMLRVENLKKQYGEFILDISLHVKKESVTGIIGRNGAGKSTLFKAILGLINPDSGSIGIFESENIKKETDIKNNIGVSLADSGFSQYFTTKNVADIMQSMYSDFDRSSFFDNCNRFELPEKKKIKDFSTGMKAKLKLIAAISHNAEFLILDEPTAGLDVVAREDIADMLREYMCKEGRSILISSHISADIEGLCDDIYMIDNGKIVLHEDMNRLKDSYGVIKITEEQFKEIDKAYLLKIKKEKYGYAALTDQRSFYQENYKGIVVEKSNIDDIIELVTRGEN